jgi:hypothetical protein
MNLYNFIINNNHDNELLIEVKKKINDFMNKIKEINDETIKKYKYFAECHDYCCCSELKRRENYTRINENAVCIIKFLNFIKHKKVNKLEEEILEEEILILKSTIIKCCMMIV